MDPKLETVMSCRVFNPDQIKGYRLFFQDSLFGALPFILLVLLTLYKNPSGSKWL